MAADSSHIYLSALNQSEDAVTASKKTDAVQRISQPARLRRQHEIQNIEIRMENFGAQTRALIGSAPDVHVRERWTRLRHVPGHQRPDHLWSVQSKYRGLP